MWFSNKFGWGTIVYDCEQLLSFVPSGSFDSTLVTVPVMLYHSIGENSSHAQMMTHSTGAKMYCQTSMINVDVRRYAYENSYFSNTS